jgi:5-methylcytosine-specific restriction protein A
VKHYLNSKEIMESFSISRTTLYRMEQEGLPFMQVGKAKRYSLEEVKVWMDDRQRGIESIIHGKSYSNDYISKTFKCGNMGGMRRSHATNTLVIFSDHSKMYDDKWYDDVLHYTGMGKKGDQDVEFAQNKTLKESKTNGIRVYLFETFVEGNHIFMGQVELVGEPYQEMQYDEEGKLRNVWMFPLRLVGNAHIVSEQIIKENEEKKQEEAEDMSTSELENRAKKAKKAGKRTTLTQTFSRDPYVAEYAKRKANGICDLCNQPAPFKDRKGKPYLEAHHLVWLSNNGPDSIDNVSALCPNCHRKMHSLALIEDVEKLKSKAQIPNR